MTAEKPAGDQPLTARQATRADLLGMLKRVFDRIIERGEEERVERPDGYSPWTERDDWEEYAAAGLESVVTRLNDFETVQLYNDL